MFFGIEGRKAWTTIMTIAALLGIGFVAGSVTSKKTVQVEVPVIETEYVERIDTVYVEKPVVRYVTRAIRDTVIIEHDVQPAGFQVLASTHQELESDGVAYGAIDVEYIMPPWDEFSIVFDPAPLPTITRTETKLQYKPYRVEPRWYETGLARFAVGAAFGGITAYYLANR